jgi:cyclopropane-fatty-acyl-phospholipid synthase
MPQTDIAAERLAKVLRHLADAFDVDLSVELWDGQVVPLGAKPASDLTLSVRDPGAIATLLRSPRMLTVVDLFMNGRIRVVNGTMLELEPRRQHIEDKIRAGALRDLKKWPILKGLAPFLLASARAPRQKMSYTGPVPQRLEGGRDDKALVQFHYDLSNDFYALFLDAQMVYSCAYFPTWETNLEDAQTAKVDMTCRKLRLQSGDRFLDIGCGWGALVCHAAKTYGVKAYGVTLSQEQYDFARARVAREGLTKSIDIELKDFREVTGEYDKIASIGMFEHVGLANHDQYFAKMRSLLRIRGLLLNHSIARRSRPGGFKKSPTMYAAVQKYIFPGGELDHIGSSLAHLENNEFDIHDVEGWREHYALTLRHWTSRLYANRSKAEAIVGGARTHAWLLYLSRCAIAFDRGAAAIFQTLASKRNVGASGLPPTRDDLYKDKLAPSAT